MTDQELLRFGQPIADVAAALMHAEYSSIQSYDAKRNGLQLIGHHGFDVHAIELWAWVSPETISSCGLSLRTGQRVVVPDVDSFPFLTTAREVYRKVGIRAMQTTPLQREGRIIGMVSTHWRQPYSPSDAELHLFDMWAQQTAGTIEVLTLLNAANHEVARATKLAGTVKELLAPRTLH